MGERLALFRQIVEQHLERLRVVPTPKAVAHKVLEGLLHFGANIWFYLAFDGRNHIAAYQKVEAIFQRVSFLIIDLPLDFVESTCVYALDVEIRQVLASGCLRAELIHVDSGYAHQVCVFARSKHLAHNAVYFEVFHGIELNTDDALCVSFLDDAVFYEIQCGIFQKDVDFGTHRAAESLQHFCFLKLGEYKCLRTATVCLLLLCESLNGNCECHK